MIILIVPIPSSYAYPGGLLNGKLLGLGPGTGIKNNQTTLATDNNEETFYSLNTRSTNNTDEDAIWYEFEKPVDLKGYRIKSDFSDGTLYLRKTDKTFIPIKQPKADGTYVGMDYKNIIAVTFQHDSGKPAKIFEFDVFSTLNPTKPILTANAGDASVNLSWLQVEGVQTYTLKRSTTSSGPYEIIADGLTGTTYRDEDVNNGVTYYYIITALNDVGVSEISNEATGTPKSVVPPIPDSNANKAILVVTLLTGLEKEFDLSMDEVNAFIDWYENKSNGSGSAKYAIDKHNNNKGPFISRKEYMIYDKILTFEVSEYSTE